MWLQKLSKYYFILFILILFPLKAKSQADSSGMILFNKGLDYYNIGNFDSAITVWKEIVENEIAKDYDTYGAAFFNIPTLYLHQKNYDNAKEWFLKIINSDLKDSDESGSLMEPHKNYKHKSAIELARIHQKDSNFYEALHWINNAGTVYRYWGFEGSGSNTSKRQAFLLEWKTDIYLKLDSLNQAKREIIIELICADNLQIFFQKSEDKLIELIKNENFKKEFDFALKNISLTQIDSTKWLASFFLNNLKYQIPISNSYPDRNIPHYWKTLFIEENTSPNKNEIIKYIQKRSFYKRL